MRYPFLFFLMVLFGFRAIAQERIDQKRIAGFEYIEIVKGVDQAKLPILIAFHYSGGNPHETIADYDSLKTAFRLIIPKGNFPKRKGYSYYPTNYYQKDSIVQRSWAKQTLDSLAKFVAEITNKYNSSVVVSGISQGGDISFMLAEYYPKLIKASFPIAAVIHATSNQTPKKNVTVPIFLFQGEADLIVSHVVTKNKVREIGKNMDIKLFTYPGVGHEISAKMKVDYSKIMDGYLK